MILSTYSPGILHIVISFSSLATNLSIQLYQPTTLSPLHFLKEAYTYFVSAILLSTPPNSTNSIEKTLSKCHLILTAKINSEVVIFLDLFTVHTIKQFNFKTLPSLAFSDTQNFISPLTFLCYILVTLVGSLFFCYP